MNNTKNLDLNFLIVDSYEEMRSIIRTMLHQLGFQNVFIAKDGLDAISILRKQEVNVIISDWNMPKVNGLQLLEEVKNKQTYSNIYFMLVTAEVEKNKIEAAIAGGVDDFIVKPFPASKLEHNLDKMLKQQPRKKQSHQTKSIEPTSPKLLKTTILIVDDQSSNIDVIKKILDDKYKVKVALNGEKALQIANKEPKPDLILLDIRMPGMDGYEVCKRLKNNIKTEDIPIIFLTAKSEIEDAAQGFKLGAVDYITKPVSSTILNARVANHLLLKSGRDKLVDQIEGLMEKAKLQENVDMMTKHDIKNPLSAIINTSESLLKTYALKAEVSNDIDRIKDAAFSMLEMINRTQDIYKIESGTYRLDAQVVDIIKITRDVIAESQHNADEFGIEIQLVAKTSEKILGEQLLCFSMLSNLIKNAIEASASTAKVIIEITAIGKNVHIDIWNKSPVPASIRSCFFQKHITSGKNNGTGLGTYSAKLMANVQNGDITFISNEKNGTTLHVTLPIA